MNARACTGTERPARWASALIGDAAREVVQYCGRRGGDREFFSKGISDRVGRLSNEPSPGIVRVPMDRVYVCAVKPARITRVHRRRSTYEATGTLIGTSDGHCDVD